MATTSPPTSLQDLCSSLGYSDAPGFYWLTSEVSDAGMPPRVAGRSSSLGVDAVYGTQRGVDGLFSPLVYFVDVSHREPGTVANIYNKVWNEGLANLLVVVTTSRLKIYNTTQQPVDPERRDIDAQGRLFDTLDLVERSLTEAPLDTSISRFDIVSGEFWKQNRTAFTSKTRVDQHLLRNLEKLKQNLTADLPMKYVNALITRSLFILYLEDRNIITESDYRETFGVGGYRELLLDSSDTYAFFSEIEQRLNGDIFEYDSEEIETVNSSHLKVIQRFLNGTNLATGQTRLFPYQFDLIPIELISSVYEQFVGTSSSGGTYYTRPELVDYMLDVHLSEPVDTFDSIVDPACGSGIFLVSALHRIVTRRQAEGHDLSPDELSKILTDRLHGYDTNGDAIQITAFSLSLKLLEYVDDAKIWKGSFELPSLVGNSLECRDFLTVSEERTYDLVLGNPPWGSLKDIESNAAAYLKNTGHPVNNNDSTQAFMWKALDLLAPNGESVLAIPCRQVLLNTQAVEFRSAFFDTVAVTGISNLALLRRTLFENADSSAAVITFEVTHNRDQRSIRYITPKPMGWGALRTIPIDEKADVKHLGREYADHPYVWKTAMYGGSADLDLIRKLDRSVSSLDEVSRAQEWLIRTGFEDKSAHEKRTLTPELAALPHMKTGDIRPYALPTSALSEYEGDMKFMRPRPLSLYEPPVITVKATITIRDREPGSPRGIKAAYQTNPVSFKSSIIGISGEENDTELQKLATLMLNSSLAHYWLFLTSVGWGTGRPSLRQEEIRSIPFPADVLLEHKKELLSKYDEIEQLVQKNNCGSAYREIIREIDERLFEYFGLSETEKDLVQSRVSQTIEYYHNRDGSSAVESVEQSELHKYGEIVCREMNKFLSHIDANLRPVVYELEAEDLPFRLLTLELRRNDAPRSDQSGSNILDQKLRSLKSHSEMFDRRTIEVYEADAVHLIKPDERRYWSRAQAANDAPELIGELIDQA
jgi:hypothetical protein